jgi:6-phosphogluconolactonase
MSAKQSPWTRRQFSQTLAASAASTLVGRSALASTPREAAGFAFIASAGASPSESGAIHVFHVNGSRWTSVQTLPAATPAHLEPHPSLPILYAVHAVGLCNNLPRGAVSAYSISPATGHLTLRNTQPLSLSATHPKHAAVTPDGHLLLVAAERGGIYNLLPIAPDGSLNPVTAIRKELGLLDGPAAKSAAPRHLIVHPDRATILAADTGQESLALFTLDHDSIRLRHRLRTHAGAGPSQIALSPSGGWVYALHATDGSVAVHRLDAEQIHPPSQIHTALSPGPALMAMHPTGRFLVTAAAGVLTSLFIDSGSGHLSTSAAVPAREPLRALAFSPGGTHLLGTGASSGYVVQIPFNAASGNTGTPQTVAQVDSASSVLFRPA